MTGFVRRSNQRRKGQVWRGRLEPTPSFFLLINVYEMFILPVAVRRGSPDRLQDTDDIWDNLSADLVIILGQAAIDSQNEDEVTARHILNAVNTVRELPPNVEARKCKVTVDVFR